MPPVSNEPDELLDQVIEDERTQILERLRSLPVPTIAGIQPRKPLHHILGGALALASDWTPAFGGPLAAALASTDTNEQIDLICVAGVGALERLADGSFATELAPGAGARFLLSLIARLQDIATVPMIDARAYAAWLK